MSCMWQNTYKDTYKDTCKDAYKDTYKDTCKDTCKVCRVCDKTHIRTHIRTHVRTHIRTHIRTHVRTHVRYVVYVTKHKCACPSNKNSNTRWLKNTQMSGWYWWRLIALLLYCLYHYLSVCVFIFHSYYYYTHTQVRGDGSVGDTPNSQARRFPRACSAGVSLHSHSVIIQKRVAYSIKLPRCIKAVFKADALASPFSFSHYSLDY